MEEFENIQFDAEMSERVDRFLRKEMSKEEAQAFIDEVKTNTELRDCYLLQFNLMRSVKFQHAAEIMKAKEMELSHVSPEIVHVPFIYRYRYALSSIAIAAMMITGVFIWDGSVTKHVGEEMYSAVVMRGGDSIDDLVNEKKYVEAIQIIDEQLNFPYSLPDNQSAIDTYNQSINDLKYRKALIFLKMGKKHKAKDVLKEINDDRSNEVLNKLLW